MANELRKDIHVPVLRALIAESLALDLVKQDRGKIVFAKMDYPDSKFYGVFYLDNVHGPYELVPLRAIGFKKISSLGHIEQYMRTKGIEGIPNLVEFNDLAMMDTTEIDLE